MIIAKEEIFMTLALCMIVKNEEKVLARCLKSAEGIFDEIIIVDTGSDDGTKSVAARFTDKIYDYPWQYDFAAARNASFSCASSDYIMWMDADDVLLEKDRAALLALKQSFDGSIDAYYLQYNAAFDEFGNVTFYFFRERIVKRACGFVWKGAVHETLQVNSNSVRLPIAVTHLRGEKKESCRNLFLYARLFASGTMPDERQKYYFARELFDNGLYDTAASAFEWFLQGDGWVEDKICACRNLASCYKILNQKDKQLAALLKSFDFDSPRPSVCCDLGEFFIAQHQYSLAVFWFKLAVNEGKTPHDGFISPDFSGFIPYMWLCYCYDRLGSIEKAKYYNDLAGNLKPLDKNYLYNKQYFDTIFSQRG